MYQLMHNSILLSSAIEERESIFVLCTIRGANERASFSSRLIEKKIKYKYVHAMRCLISLFETAIFITLRCGKFSVFGHVERASSNFLIY